MNNTFEVKMKYKKSTKGTHVYGNDESEILTTVYIKKGEVPNNPPKAIKVTIEVIE